ncbi:NAD(P)-dependent oxidoreductase [Halarcobacter bivalviorum]|uniref:Glyoxylate/hydroxypyruvate reductase A n=1 Tax=Halarcobacter bivalviorum TaxID=663364 RepID=A0AAX2AA93_9BACT|nr:NAD(P)-dependent oxidoreductase [Halarcobacter bivalviorum]AXH12568.1 glyoxylate/hydroxypyruvate reductase A [Halarcobacter bivalviorum]RXK10507.1 glyoxylate/hydroxypyruvate reductase A [Halarcobacter bivalviorum]
MKRIVPFVSGCDEETTNLWLEHLQRQMSEYKIIPFEELSEEQKLSSTVAIVANPNPKDIAQLKNLKWIQSLWAGVEKLLQDLPNSSFKIVRMTDLQLAKTMAESVLAWTLYLHKNMPLYLKQQKQKQWKQHIETLPEERNILVLGLGNLGLMSVQKLKENGFSVSGWARTKKEIEGVTTFYEEEGLIQALKGADIVVCLLPLTDETKNLLNKQKLDLLHKKASLINFARGAIIDYEYLAKRLDKKELCHAVLDVFDIEPLPSSSSFWENENITVLPHISAPTNMKTASKIASKNILEYFKKGIIPPFVDTKKGY